MIASKNDYDVECLGIVHIGTVSVTEVESMNKWPFIPN